MVHIPIAQASSTTEAEHQIEAIKDYLTYSRGISASLTPAQLRNAIKAGADWAVASQEETGHFKYEYIPASDTYRADDNMVRQAGTLFMLSEVYKAQADKDPKIAVAIEKSISYFETVTRKGNGTFSCIVKSEHSNVCTLGSTSLALVGILNYVDVLPQKKAVYKEQIEAYKNYLLQAKFKDAGFSASYTPARGFEKKESSFFNGEAMLALVKYYRYRSDDEIQQILFDSFAYLAAAPTYDNNLYLWIMAALKDMQTLWPNPAFAAYARRFTIHRMAGTKTLHLNQHNYCPAVEGMTSAYSILKEQADGSYVSDLKTEINYWLARTEYLQVSGTNPYHLAVINGVPQLLRFPNLKVAEGGFLTGGDEVTERIDFTQHCLSAYLQALTAIESQPL